jgi:sulfur carrier protein ThiS
MEVVVRVYSGGFSEEKVEIPEEATYELLLEKLGINPEVVVVFWDGSPVPLDEPVFQGDISVLRVVTGG